MTYTIYNKITGEIIGRIDGSLETVEMNIAAENDFLSGFSDADFQYIDLFIPEVVDKSQQTILQDIDEILANGIEKSTFSNVAVGSKIFINGVSKGVEIDGTTELTFDTFGIYNVRFVLFPYLDMEFTVNAN